MNEETNPAAVRSAAQIWHDLGEAYRSIHWYREASQAYQEVVLRETACYEVWIKLGTCHARSGELEEAVRVFAHVLNMQPENTLAWTILGDILQNQRTKILPMHEALGAINPELAEKLYVRYGFLGPSLR